MHDRAANTLAWTSWPAKERPGAAVVGAIAVLCFSVTGGVVAGHWLAGVGCAVALIAALQRFFFPVQCEITEHGATVRTLLGSRSIRLTSVRRVVHDGNVMLLSSRSVASNLDTVRGFMLPLPSNAKEGLLPKVLGRIEQAKRVAA